MTISRSISRGTPPIKNCIGASSSRSAGGRSGPSQHVKFGRELVHGPGTRFGDDVRITEEHAFGHVFATGMDLDAQSHSWRKGHVLVGSMRCADERAGIERIEDAVHEWCNDGVTAVLDDLARSANVLRRTPRL